MSEGSCPTSAGSESGRPLLEALDDRRQDSVLPSSGDGPRRPHAEPADASAGTPGATSPAPIFAEVAPVSTVAPADDAALADTTSTADVASTVDATPAPDPASAAGAMTAADAAPVADAMPITDAKPAAAAAPAPPGSGTDDDDEVCGICHSGEFTEDNLIVFCEGSCGLGFHQKCYGVESVPPGDEPWYCDLCAAGCGPNTYRKGLSCCHYKNDWSARTLVVTDRPHEQHFVHVQCAAYIPFVNTSTIPFTTNVPRIKGGPSKCFICEARFGYQVRCSHPDDSGDGICPNSFHPMCAIRNRFLEPPPVYTTKYDKHLCPVHHPSTRSRFASASKRRRDADTGGLDERSKKSARRPSPPPSQPRARGRAAQSPNTPTSKDAQGPQRPPAQAKPSVASGPRRRLSTRTGLALAERGRGSSQGRRAERATRSASTSDDDLDLSPAEDLPPRRAGTRARGLDRGHGRSRRVSSIDEDDEDGGGEYKYDPSTATSRNESTEVVLENGRVGRPYAPHASSPRPIDESPEPRSPRNGHNGYRNSKDGKRIVLALGDPGSGYHGAGSFGSNADDSAQTPPRHLAQRHNQQSWPAQSQLAHASMQLPPQPPLSTSPASYGDRSHAQSAKRPTIRIKPFANTTPSPVIGRGTLPQHLPAGLRSYSGGLGAVHGTYDAASTTPVATRLPDEQERWLKESHEMLQKQASLLQQLQEAVRELAAQPSQKAQNAMSTISSLSALVSDSSTQQAQITPLLALQNGATFAGPGRDTNTAGSPGTSSNQPIKSPLLSLAQQQPQPQPQQRPALQLSQLYGRSAPASGASTSSNGTPKLATAAELMLPRPSDSPPGSAAVDVATGELSVEAELDLFKGHVMYLLKRVDMPNILSKQLSPNEETAADGRNQAFTDLVADLRRLGAMTKNNVRDYVEVFVRSLEKTERG